jgi:23S rRNA pseudouridine2605 synthase
VRVGKTVITELGYKADPRREAIFVDGQKLIAEPLAYVVLQKPRNVVCTLSDPEGRSTVKELVSAVGARLRPVGRLDYHTSGVLLLTNDGDFAAKLAHPSTRSMKEYVAKVQGKVRPEDIESWQQQIVIDGKATQPAEVHLMRHEGDKSWIRIVLHEGRNRQIRRLGEATGFPVMRLARTEFAGITSEDLRPGQWRYLSTKELAAFRKEHGVPRSVRRPPTTRPMGKTVRERYDASKGTKKRARKVTRAEGEQRPPTEADAESFAGARAPRPGRKKSVRKKTASSERPRTEAPRGPARGKKRQAKKAARRGRTR